jgi:voltage-gated potassium channel Kch
MLYLRRLREHNKRVPVVVVDTDHNHPYRLAAEALRARFITGSITSNSLIATLALRRARRVLLLTGDDFSNVDAAASMLAEAPNLRDRMVIHVADLRFKQLMSVTSVARHAEVFNLYQVAAVHLVQTELLPYFEQTEFRDIVVFAGFGRLGQTILDELQRRAPDAMSAVIIVDVEASERVAVFDEQCGVIDSYQRHVIEGDANGLRVWQRVEELYDFRERAPAFLLVSGSDALNLRLALRVSQRFPDARTVARTYYRSSFADEVSREAGFHTFSVADEAQASIPDSWLD